MLIQCDMLLDVKFLSTVVFTFKDEGLSKYVEDNLYYPRILIATTSCILEKI